MGLCVRKRFAQALAQTACRSRMIMIMVFIFARHARRIESLVGPSLEKLHTYTSPITYIMALPLGPRFCCRGLGGVEGLSEPVRYCPPLQLVWKWRLKQTEENHCSQELRLKCFITPNRHFLEKKKTSKIAFQGRISVTAGSAFSPLPRATARGAARRGAAVFTNVFMGGPG